ncbi:hypothetical protein BDF22DRAFT_673942 [Syncephalis plumigaleata]|nr:hypothetical protein BDF22DRAFT_673942 [Syncephalis plumigaleata]
MLLRLYSRPRVLTSRFVKVASFHSSVRLAAVSPDKHANSLQSLDNGRGAWRDSAEIATRTASLQLFMSRWASELFYKQKYSEIQQQDKGEHLINASETIASTAVVTDIVDFMTDEERTLVMSKFGTWTEENIEQHQFDWEAMGNIRYFIAYDTILTFWHTIRHLTMGTGHTTNIPGYAEQFEHKHLLLATGIQPTKPETLASFINYATSSAVQLPSNEVVALWHWRAKAQSLLELPQKIDAASPDSSITLLKDLPAGIRDMIRRLPQAITSVTARAHADGIITDVIEEDFAVPRSSQSSTGSEELVAYRTLGEWEHYKLYRIALARRQAFTWLSGRIEAWNDKIPEELEKLDQSGSIWAVAQ